MLNVMHGNLLVSFQDVYTELNQRLQKSLSKLPFIYSDAISSNFVTAICDRTYRAITVALKLLSQW